jgi:hypothetical protein
MAQVVETLTSKHKAMSSNPSIIKKSINKRSILYKVLYSSEEWIWEEKQTIES